MAWGRVTSLSRVNIQEPEAEKRDKILRNGKDKNLKQGKRKEAL